MDSGRALPLSARFSVPCGRCLEPAPVSYDEHIYMVYEAQESVGALPDSRRPAA